MVQLFLSHSSADDGFVRELREALADLGQPVWIDSRQLKGGDPLWSEINAAAWCSPAPTGPLPLALMAADTNRSAMAGILAMGKSLRVGDSLPNHFSSHEYYAANSLM
jgi:hypothetical protein